MQHRLARGWRWGRTHPSAVLLIVQLLGILLYAFVDDSPANSVGRLGLSLFGMLVVVLALAVVRATPAYTWLGLLSGIPAALSITYKALGLSKCWNPAAEDRGEE